MFRIAPHRDSTFRKIAGAVLCCILPCQFLDGQAIKAPASKPQDTSSAPLQKTQSKLTPEERDLHVLNRFAFGPTPRSLADIRELGIDPWFELQLHPDRLPVSAADQQLGTRLANFPAMQLPVGMLLDRFPSGAETRQAANGKRAIPSDPAIAAIYRRHIALYDDKQAKKAEDSKAGITVAGLDTAKAQLSQPAVDMAMSQSAKPDTSLAENKPPAMPDATVTAILALAPDKRLSRIFSLSLTDYQALRASLKGPQKLLLTQDMSPYQRELLADYDNPTRTVVEELQSQRLLRDIYSSHQLQEVMTTFWLNHFNVYLHKNEETPYYLVSYERDVIRPRALGNFEDLLVATAESPAMLLYLDNSSSTGPDSTASQKQKLRAAQAKNPAAKKALPAGLNENYARELMELHTLGVNGGYTQKDVTEVAKVFTGWTVDHPGQGGAFFFDESRHEPGKKTVMGRKIKENSQTEGLQLLHTLATSPATAHFISQELAIAFVSDTPPPALVNRMEQSFLRSHGDIPSVLRAMLHSPEFWSPAIYQTKVKTPLEYVVSTARASNADITNTQPLINQLNQMGMPLYACVPPTGYSAKADAWVSTGALVTRMNFGLSIATNHYPGIQASWSIPATLTNNSAASAVESYPADIAESEHRLELQLVPTGLSEKTRSAVIEQAGNQPAQPLNVAVASKPVSPASQAAAVEKQNSQLAGLILGSPEFQRR